MYRLLIHFFVRYMNHQTRAHQENHWVYSIDVTKCRNARVKYPYKFIYNFMPMQMGHIIYVAVTS